jgi:flagellar basal body rod protein FlgB
LGSTTLINLSNLIALRRHLDIAANNVANVQTAGFRAQQPTFQKYLKHERNPEIGIASSRPKSLVDAAMAFTSTATGPMRPTGIRSISPSTAMPISLSRRPRESATHGTDRLRSTAMAGS